MYRLGIMVRGEAPRLFESADELSELQLRQEASEALAPAEAPSDPDLDTANLWISSEDHLLVRGVKPHSAEKSRLVSRMIDTVTTAMSGKWFERRYGLEYVELYSGPGRLLDERTGEEQPGSPLQALNLTKPFSNYVFSDFSADCIEALRVRVGRQSKVSILEGDANSTTHLEKVCSQLNRNALIIAYLDPARPQDLRWSTVEILATRFNHIDLIINLPVNSLMRSIMGAHGAGATGAGSAGRFLNHLNPGELIFRNHAGKFNNERTVAAIRQYYYDQLGNLEFRTPDRRTVDFPFKNPFYDVLYVSRHQTAIDLWNNANPKPDPPLQLF